MPLARSPRRSSQDQCQRDDEAETIGDDQQAQASLEAGEEEQPGQTLACDDADVASSAEAAEPFLQLGAARDGRDQRRERGPERAHVRAQEEGADAVAKAVGPEQQRQAADDTEEVGDRYDPRRADAVYRRAGERPDGDPDSRGDRQDDAGAGQRQVRDLERIDQLERR